MHNSLEEIYSIIDTPSFIVIQNYTNEVLPLFISFRNNQDKEKKIEEIKNAQAEIDIQSFSIYDNELRASFYGEENGVNFEYPNLDSWKEQEFEYLINRQQSTQNPYLKAKYSHLLWLSKRKHSKYALDAISSYKVLIQKIDQTARDTKEVNKLPFYIANALYLSISTGNRQEIGSIKELVLELVRKFNSNYEYSYINISLIKLILKNPKVFIKSDLTNIDKICEKFAFNQKNLHSKIKVLEVCNQVANKLGIKTNIYDDAIAHAYETLSIQREDDTNLAAIKFCLDATKYYKKTKNIEKIAELSLRYKALKKTMRLGHFRQKVDMREIYYQKALISDEVLNYSHFEILNFLATSNKIFPSFNQLNEMALKLKEENNSMFIFSNSTFDSIGHTSANYDDESEKMHNCIMRIFSIILIESLILIDNVIGGAIANGKMNYTIFSQYIKSTWLGQNIKITYLQNEELEYNWLDILGPGIKEFFNEIMVSIENSDYILNYILPIDSLSIKIEGIIRDMGELRGNITHFISEDSQGRVTSKEMDINALLRSDWIKDLLSPDDIMLLQFLLIDKSGYNLRNRIAHSLIKQSDSYHLAYIYLLIIAILKLSQYDEDIITN